MPTYEYECTKCKERFDLFQRMTEKPLQKCRFCGGKVRRLIGAGAGLIFKGSGFYATDYRSENYRQREKQEKSKDEGEKTFAKDKPGKDGEKKAVSGKPGEDRKKEI